MRASWRKTLALAFGMAQQRRQKLKRNRAAKPMVERAIHHAHSATACYADNLVIAADRIPGNESTVQIRHKVARARPELAFSGFPIVSLDHGSGKA